MAKTILIFFLSQSVALIFRVKIKSGWKYFSLNFWAEKLYPKVINYADSDFDINFAWKCHPDFQGQVQIWFLSTFEFFYQNLSWKGVYCGNRLSPKRFWYCFLSESVALILRVKIGKLFSFFISFFILILLFFRSIFYVG